MANRAADGSIYNAKLNYVTANGQGYSATPETLSDVLLPDNTEVILTTATACGASDCGVVLPGSQAHHGWAGVNKMFMFEYSMPLSGLRSTTLTAPNPDMPAIWLLNSKVTNGEQYGCSCWGTGCGEFDIHEVLQPGDATGYSSMHMGDNYAGTPPNGLARPTGATMKLAVIITDNVAQVQVLPDTQTFDDVIAADVVNSFLGVAPTNGAVTDVVGAGSEVFAVTLHPFTNGWKK